MAPTVKHTSVLAQKFPAL